MGRSSRGQPVRRWRDDVWQVTGRLAADDLKLLMDGEGFQIFCYYVTNIKTRINRFDLIY